MDDTMAAVAAELGVDPSDVAPHPRTKLGTRPTPAQLLDAWAKVTLRADRAWLRVMADADPVLAKRLARFRADLNESGELFDAYQDAVAALPKTKRAAQEKRGAAVMADTVRKVAALLDGS